jgi:hypothetical protein
MTQTLYELLRECTVAISASGAKGTGFFVAPGQVLTCAHVIEPAKDNPASIEISWRGQSYRTRSLAMRDATYPDIALLEVGVSDHPCVLLSGGAQPHHQLYSYGYPDIEQQGAPTTFHCEGLMGARNDLLRLKDGQVRPGMSGSPILNEATGGVCAIMQASRDRSSALGGKALLAQAIYAEFPALEALQQQFHTRDTRWSDALTTDQRKALGLKWLPSPPAPDTLEIFYSYAHKDEKLRDELETALVMMRRQQLITNWHDRDIDEGGEFAGEISEHLESANIILLLVSNDFIKSEYCYDKEMMRAMQRHDAGTAVVIPIILRPCQWHEAPFGKLKALPRDGKPITSWSDRDEAFLDVANGIRRVVKSVKKI